MAVMFWVKKKSREINGFKSIIVCEYMRPHLMCRPFALCFRIKYYISDYLHTINLSSGASFGGGGRTLCFARP